MSTEQMIQDQTERDELAFAEIPERELSHRAEARVCRIDAYSLLVLREIGNISDGMWEVEYPDSGLYASDLARNEYEKEQDRIIVEIAQRYYKARAAGDDDTMRSCAEDFGRMMLGRVTSYAKEIAERNDL